jgi:molybdate transport system substrate-binding protein
VPVRVAAAADLAMAMDEIAKELRSRAKLSMEVTLGSSGLLAKQIEQGAPFSLFLSANREFVQRVVAAGKCDGATVRTYGRGRIAVWTRAGAPAPRAVGDLADGARYRRIAIANPDHAPYGVAARQAFERLGIWEQVKTRVVLGENVQATMVYARDGNADAAIVALSLVAAGGGNTLRIDESLHEPLEQQLVVCGAGAGAAGARQLADFITSADGRELLSRYGLTLPGAPAAAPPPRGGSGPGPGSTARDGAGGAP